MKPELFLKGLDDRLEWLLEDFPFLKTPARAFTAWVLLNHAVSEDDLAVSVIDGPQDKGIDAIHVPEDGERLLVVQTKLTSKHESNFSANAIVNTFNGIDWLLNGKLDEVDNPLFRSRSEEFREAFLATFPSVEVIFAATSKGPADDGMAEIAKFEENYGTDFVVEILDLEALSEVFRRALTSTTPNIVDLELVDAPYERQVGDTRAIVGSVSGDQVAQLIEQFGTAIFEANIRSYLGSVKINRAIMTTATSDEAMNFLFYKNGLTFVCDELSFRSAREATHVRLKSAQIVNGCQTATALYEAKKLGRLKSDTEVFVRIIQRPDPEFVGRVTLSTNSQNGYKPPTW